MTLKLLTSSETRRKGLLFNSGARLRSMPDARSRPAYFGSVIGYHNAAHRLLPCSARVLHRPLLGGIYGDDAMAIETYRSEPLTDFTQPRHQQARRDARVHVSRVAVANAAFIDQAVGSAH